MKKQEIKFDKRNYRKHNDENKRVIKKSLEELGAGRSIVIDNEGEIIAGNGVYEQAQKLGIKTKIVETDGSELVVVKRTDLATGDDKRKKLALADNAASDTSEWADELLREDWTPEVLAEFGVVLPEAPDESALNDLFEDDNTAKKNKGAAFIIEIPKRYEGVIEDIKAAVTVTLEQWHGCSIK